MDAFLSGWSDNRARAIFFGLQFQPSVRLLVAAKQVEQFYRVAYVDVSSAKQAEVADRLVLCNALADTVTTARPVSQCHVTLYHHIIALHPYIITSSELPTLTTLYHHCATISYNTTILQHWVITLSRSRVTTLRHHSTTSHHDIMSPRHVTMSYHSYSVTVTSLFTEHWFGGIV